MIHAYQIEGLHCGSCIAKVKNELLKIGDVTKAVQLKSPQAMVNKRKIRCACLGAVFNLPISTVTLIEDLLMVGMALVTLIIVTKTNTHR